MSEAPPGPPRTAPDLPPSHYALGLQIMGHIHLIPLTTFIQIPQIKEGLRRQFPLADVRLKNILHVPPRTRNYFLIGRAFDYLLRWEVKRLNPSASESEWIAEKAPERLSGREHRLAEDVVRTAKAAQTTFLKSGKFSESIGTSLMQLARLDSVFRESRFLPGIGHSEEAADLKDLRDLLKLARGCPHFRARGQHPVVLNPPLGVGNLLADADMIINQTLIDVKTTKTVDWENTYYQLTAYCLLRWGRELWIKMKGTTRGEIRDRLALCPRVRFLAAYYARFGEWLQVAAPKPTRDFFEIAAWFLREAQKVGARANL